MIVAGIDEAGLGPVLGPLVVSATAFSMPAKLADVSLWQVLSSAVSRKPAKRASRIAIADSKKLYSSQKEDGIKHLERGVLTMLACSGQKPANLSDLLAAVCPQAISNMSCCPWYSHQALPLPRTISQTAVNLCANALSLRLDQTGVGRPVFMQAEVVFESEFNRLIQATDNKSVATFDVLCRLLMRLWKLSAGQDMKIIVDRQGGRMHYLPALQRIFEGCQFKILDETDRLSAYRLTDGRRTVEMSFLVEAEDQHMGVALGSMLSKYLRELFMELFNKFWGMHVPQIEPTAGYHGDGTRFYREIQDHVRRLGLDEDMLWRRR